MKPIDPLSAAGAYGIKLELSQLRSYWYSPFDFGYGVTVGDWKKRRRFARRLKLFNLPADLTGKRVLDIGSWDGYWALELERRGANVLCIDTWDDPEQLAQFLFVKQHFNLQMQHRQLDVQFLNPYDIGTFNITFCAGVLYHLHNPLDALTRMRLVTKDLLILETVAMIPFVHESFPMIAFFPGDPAAILSNRHWGISGAATVTWLKEALTFAGFNRVEVKYQPSFRPLKKLWALCTNRPQGGRVVIHAWVK